MSNSIYIVINGLELAFQSHEGVGTKNLYIPRLPSSRTTSPRASSAAVQRVASDAGIDACMQIVCPCTTHTRTKNRESSVEGSRFGRNSNSKKIYKSNSKRQKLQLK